MASNKITKNKSKTIAIAVCSSFLAVVLIILTVFGVLSDGFKNWDFLKEPEAEEVESICVLLNGNVCKELPFTDADTTRIYVEYGGKYSVKIQPKESALFDFKLDGKYHPFSKKSGDYNRAFNVQIHEDYFELDTSGKKMIDILNIAYFGHVISDVPEEDLTLNCYFECIVTAENGTVAVFDILGIGSYLAICLDHKEIVF